MPHKPKKPCSYPGCPNLTDETYCEVHKNMVAKQYNKFQRSPDHAKKYGRGWKRIRFICDHYSSSCFQIRNVWMVDRSARVIAVYNGEAGGTRNTIKYADKCGVPVVNVL